MTLKALPNTSLSSGELKLYAFDEAEHTIGCVELFNYDPLNQRAAVGIVVATPLRNLGHGTAMLKELTHFCRNNTSLHQLYADIASLNQPSIRIFQHAGYQLCGTFRQWVIKDGQYFDTHRYQLLLDETH